MPYAHRQMRTVLTGRVSVRSSILTRRLTLRVEVRTDSRPAWAGTCPPPPNCADPVAWHDAEAAKAEREWRPCGTAWRDATLDDLRTVGLIFTRAAEPA